MKPTTVKSYVRNKPQHVTVQDSEAHNEIAYVMIGMTIVSLAIVYASISIPLGLTLGAAYGVKTIIAQQSRAEVIEAVTEPENAPQDKPKRHYERRLTVHQYDTGKTIRI